MRKEPEKSGPISVKAPSDLAARTERFLRQIHPTKTAEAVASDTGIAASTVAKWLEGASAPSGLALLLLTGAYGPEFLSAVMPWCPEWLDAAKREEEQRRLRAEIAALQERLDRSAA